MRLRLWTLIVKGLSQVSTWTRVLIGFSLIPKLSWERSSGDMIEWLEGLAGLEPLLDEEAKCGCLWKPKPIKKHSIGTIMEFGCSSVTSEPQASTWSSEVCKAIVLCLCVIWVSYVISYLMDMDYDGTSTSAQILLSIFVLMWIDSAWNGLLSPANISVLHCKFFSPSLRSRLLQVFQHFGNESWEQMIISKLLKF